MLRISDNLSHAQHAHRDSLLLGGPDTDVFGHGLGLGIARALRPRCSRSASGTGSLVAREQVLTDEQKFMDAGSQDDDGLGNASVGPYGALHGHGIVAIEQGMVSSKRAMYFHARESWYEAQRDP